MPIIFTESEESLFSGHLKGRVHFVRPRNRPAEYPKNSQHYYEPIQAIHMYQMPEDLRGSRQALAAGVEAHNSTRVARRNAQARARLRGGALVLPSTVTGPGTSVRWAESEPSWRRRPTPPPSQTRKPSLGALVMRSLRLRQDTSRDTPALRPCRITNGWISGCPVQDNIASSTFDRKTAMMVPRKTARVRWADDVDDNEKALERWQTRIRVEDERERPLSPDWRELQGSYRGERRYKFGVYRYRDGFWYVEDEQKEDTGGEESEEVEPAFSQ